MSDRLPRYRCGLLMWSVLYLVLTLAVAVRAQGQISRTGTSEERDAHRSVQSGAPDSLDTRIGGLLEADSLNVVAWRLMAVAAQRHQKVAAAEAAWHRVLSLKSDDSTAFFALAELALDRGALDSAAVLVGHALKSAGDGSLRARFLQGRLYELRAMPDSALATYTDIWRRLELRELF
ncbi:MAG TPA: hypothetical protein VLB27_07860 [candidate division Zixibacteria bacterium]|nr:hypothetical protein [candidate division Zixibacteria bacterium]